MRNLLKRLLWTAPLLAVAYGQQAAPLFRCTKHSPVKVVTTTTTGEIVEGPACAEVTVNALRYSAEFSKTFTYTAGPSLVSVFPSSFTAGAGAPTTRAAVTLESEFRDYEKQLQDRADELARLESADRKASAALDGALRTLKELVTQSDDILQNSGAGGVMVLVKGSAFQQALRTANSQRLAWETSDNIVDALRRLQLSLNGLAAKYPTNSAPVTADYCAPANIDKLGWTDWYTKCREAEFKLKAGEVDKLIAEAAPFTSDGDKAAAIAKKSGIALYWQTTSDTLTPDLFVRQVEVSCSPLFNKNSQTVLKLTLMDRAAIFDQQAPSPLVKDNLLTVQCASRFALAGGVGFSGVSNREFAIVKGEPAPPATTATNRFEVVSDPSVHPIPLAAVHALLAETPDHLVGLNASFGVGVNVRSQNAGGTCVEFLLGPSVSFLRTIFLTVGAQIGKTTGLAGGFSPGATVPSDVTAVQLTSSYGAAWGFAVTFTKP